MKNNGKIIVIIILLILVIIGLGGYIYFNTNSKNNSTGDNNIINNDKNNTSNIITSEPNTGTTSTTSDNSANTSKEMNSFILNSQDGEEIVILAYKLVSATGFAGSSNYIYYLIDDNLYFRDISNTSNKEEIIANGITDLYIENREVVADLSNDGKILKENQYISYK